MLDVKAGAHRLPYLPAVQIPEALRAVPDIVPMLVRAGQVLVYPRHVPPGVFVVLAGALRLLDGERVDARSVPFAIPGPDELGEPAQTGVEAATDAEILFVPRSVALRDGSIARLLAAAGVVTVPLHHRRAG